VRLSFMGAWRLPRPRRDSLAGGGERAIDDAALAGAGSLGRVTGGARDSLMRAVETEARVAPVVEARRGSERFGTVAAFTRTAIAPRLELVAVRALVTRGAARGLHRERQRARRGGVASDEAAGGRDSSA